MGLKQRGTNLEGQLLCSYCSKSVKLSRTFSFWVLASSSLMRSCDTRAWQGRSRHHSVNFPASGIIFCANERLSSLSDDKKIQLNGCSLVGERCDMSRPALTFFSSFVQEFWANKGNLRHHFHISSPVCGLQS